MRIESIVIRNFRQYKSLEFEFPRKKECDLHVIEGTNGMGKTNLLNAITWCLYGQEPHLGIESQSLPRINIDTIKEANTEGKEFCDLQVQITARDDNKVIVYERKQQYLAKTNFGYRDEFSVTVMDQNQNVNTIIYEGDKAKEYVTMYMPETIREYFFFDGEHLYQYFINDQSKKIKDSIHTISQVQLLTSIKGRLDIIIVDKQREAGSLNPDIAKLTNNKQRMQTGIDNLLEDIKKIEDQNDVSEKIIKRNSEFLKGQEDIPDKEEKYEKLKNSIVSEKIELEEIDKELLALIIEYKTLFAFYPYIKSTLDMINDKEAIGALPPNIDKNYLANMIKIHQCLICKHSLNESEEEEVQRLIDQINVSSELSNLLMSIKSDLEKKLDEIKLYPEKKERILKKKKNKENEINKLSFEVDELDSYLKGFSDKVEIARAHRERIEHEILVKNNLRKLGVYEEQCNKKIEEYNQAEDKLNKALNQKDECKKINELIEAAYKAKKIVEEIEQEMMSEVRENIREETMTIFKTLIWKKNTYDHIELDESYKLDLVHVDGYKCVGSCSAAERALLALSYTLSLQNVSGFNSMLFIDTPVSRVSDINRCNFANVLRDVSKNKQIIMTFAPSEYSDEIRNVFEPIASTSVKLDTVDERTTFLCKEIIL